MVGPSGPRLPDGHAELDWVRAFDPAGDERARWSKQRLIALLEAAQEPFDRRQFEPGHVTGSAIVLSPDRQRVLLVHHRRLGRWLQPGGHVEPGDASVLATALREVAEETAVMLDPEVEPCLVGVDVHEIPAAGDEPAHLHHDLVWRLAARDLACRASDESHEVRWFPLESLPQVETDDRVRAHATRASTLGCRN